MATSFYTRFPGGAANIVGSVDVNIHDSAGNNISNGQQTMANSVPVAIATNQTAVPVSAASLPLPSGAATEATLSTLNGKVTACNTGAVVVSSSALPTGAATEATLATRASEATVATLATQATLSTLNGKFGSIGQQAMAASAPVVIASNQTAVPVSVAINAAGNSPGSSTVSTVATLTAPANTVGFILMILDTATANVRYRIGATATASSGQQLQPGRDTGYIPCAANISICAESGTQPYDVQWILSA